MAHYTWSKAQAHESDYYFNNPKADYGNSYYNRKNVFVMTGNWNLPFGRGQQFAGNVPGWVNQVIGGFMLNGSWTWESGLPFTPSYQLCTQSTRTSTDKGAASAGQAGLVAGKVST